VAKPFVQSRQASRVTRPLSSLAVFNLRRPSLLRGTILVLGSFAASFPLSGFPQTRATLLLVIPALLAMFGTLETALCMRPKRDLYHAGVVMCLFMDLLATCLIFFFLLFPYVV
jgi:hypothetical protein